MHSIKDNAGFAAERSQGYCALHGFCTPQLKQQGFALTPLTSEEADSLLDSSDDFLALGMQAPAEVDEGDLFRVPSSFARDIGDLQVSEKGASWLVPSCTMSTSDHSMPLCVTPPTLGWEPGLHSASCPAEAIPKRRMSASEGCSSSGRHLDHMSQVEQQPAWNQSSSQLLLNPFADAEVLHRQTKSLPRMQTCSSNQGRKQLKARAGIQKNKANTVKPSSVRDYSHVASFPASAKSLKGHSQSGHPDLMHKGNDLRINAESSSAVYADSRPTSKSLVYRIRSNALTNRLPTGSKDALLRVPCKADMKPSSSTVSEGHVRMPSSPEISSEQGLKTTLEEGSPSADALEVQKEGHVAVDANKLAQFIDQINTIQNKVVSLQLERQVNLKRMKALEVSADELSNMMEDLAHMKASGATMQEREIRLEEGYLELQRLLGTIKQGISRDLNGK